MADVKLFGHSLAPLELVLARPIAQLCPKDLPNDKRRQA